MALRVGLIGLPNTGKSFAWKSFKHGSSVFAICPSHKILHVRKEDGSMLQPLNISIEGVGSNIQELCKAKNISSPHELVSALMPAILSGAIDKSKINITGNYVVCTDIKYVRMYKMFVDKFMPQIKIILCPDFTHFISNIIQNPAFINRKAGGEAFQRFWELAAETLNNIITSSDELLNIVLDVTEYHAEYNEALNQFNIFTPAGKMLTEKFLPESYYELMLHTYVEPYDPSGNEGIRYKFVVLKQDRYDGRSMDLFNDIQVDGKIPNDMEIVISRIFKFLGKNFEKSE